MSVEPVSASAPGESFAALRERFERRHREATAAAFALGDEALVRTEIPELDAALGGGFPRGTIGTLEGPPSSGRSAVAARLLAAATRRGLAAMVAVDLFPPALAAAGVRLERLLLVNADVPLDAARAADIIVRSGAFTVVAIPALPSGRGTGAATWTRLASLAHRSNTLLVALGDDISTELRYFASLRLSTSIERVRWNGPPGHLGELAGYDVRAVVRKHKRAAPAGEALIRCDGFEDRPLAGSLRERVLTDAARPAFRAGRAGVADAARPAFRAGRAGVS